MGTAHRSPSRRSSRYSMSPARTHKSPQRSLPQRSPIRHKCATRAISPFGAGTSHMARSPLRDKLSNQGHSSLRVHSVSPISRSPSPRMKRLKRTQAGRDVIKEADRNGNRDEEKARHKERKRNLSGNNERVLYRDREVAEERRREMKDGSFSRSRHEHSYSPRERYHNNRRNEVASAGGVENCRNSDGDSIAKMKAAEEALESKQKQKPSFELSGKLAEETNRVRGITLLFNEPPDARKPDIRWRLYVFKAGEILNDPLYIHRQSCYLFGRERRVADIPTDHPSCSKQHAVIQFRLVEEERANGMFPKQVRPYLIDLGSTNGTFINDNHIEPQRYYELFEKDTIRFGNSSREYVILHENSTE